jgi:hypothetical protein
VVPELRALTDRQENRASGGKGGNGMETLPKFGVSRVDMMKRVARFKDLKGSDGGLPDSKAPPAPHGR